MMIDICESQVNSSISLIDSPTSFGSAQVGSLHHPKSFRVDAHHHREESPNADIMVLHASFERPGNLQQRLHSLRSPNHQTSFGKRRSSRDSTIANKHKPEKQLLNKYLIFVKQMTRRIKSAAFSGWAWEIYRKKEYQINSVHNHYLHSPRELACFAHTFITIILKKIAANLLNHRATTLLSTMQWSKINSSY